MSSIIATRTPIRRPLRVAVHAEPIAAPFPNWDDEEEEEDEWMTVYVSWERFGAYVPSAPSQYHDFRYYQCWGGGPDGGYITNGHEVYRVNREWSQPFTIEPIHGSVDVSYRHNIKHIRII